MVQFDHIGNSPESCLEVGDLLESIPKLDDGRLAEHSIRVHNEFAMFQAIQVARDEQ
jgi:hypothetical protein